MDRQNRIEELRWKSERIEKQTNFADKIKLLNLENPIEFLSFVESDNFQKTVEEWPKDKFEKNLYVQIEINKIDIATKLLKSYLKKIQSDFVLIFLMNYNLGLIKIDKTTLIENWFKILELDGDEFHCYNPLSSDFVCIEKTEGFIVGKENEGIKWFYEITYSNEKIMNQENNGS